MCWKTILQQLFKLKKHSFITDEPASAGFVTCSVMTIKLYAARKKWDLQEVFVYITYSKKHSDDLEMDLNTPARFDHLHKKLKFLGNLDKKQVQRLKEIAAKCPVHKTLQSKIIIETEIVSD